MERRGVVEAKDAVQRINSMSESMRESFANSSVMPLKVVSEKAVHLRYFWNY